MNLHHLNNQIEIDTGYPEVAVKERVSEDDMCIVNLIKYCFG